MRLVKGMMKCCKGKLFGIGVFGRMNVVYDTVLFFFFIKMILKKCVGIVIIVGGLLSIGYCIFYFVGLGRFLFFIFFIVLLFVVF